MVLLVALVAAGLATPANTVEGQIKFNPAKMLDVTQLEAGMEGTCRTVYQGTKITEFHVRIIGLLKGSINGQDMILIRMLDGPSVEKGYNIIGGMSGSPVYIKGKLIGAVAYGWSFPKEPICGVTPIRAMLEASAPSGAEGGANLAAAPAFLGGHMVTSYRIAGQEEADRKPFASDTTINLVPLSIPVAVTGASPKGLTLLKRLFAGTTFEVVQGATGSGYSYPPKEAANTKLEPGSAVGIDLLSGDVSAVGFGTVTYVEGNKVLAFGHPMDEFGSLRMPLCTMYVVGINSSLARSNKFGVKLKTVGALLQDRPWSVGGVIGEKAPTVPMQIDVTDLDRDLHRHFSVVAASHPDYTPAMLDYALNELTSSVIASGSPATVDVDFQVKCKGHPLIHRLDRLYSPSAPTGAVVTSLDNILYLLTSNNFEQPRLEWAKVSLSATGKQRLATLEDLYCPRNKVKPGEEVPLVVTLAPYKGKYVQRTIKLRIPPECPDGTIKVAVGGGRDYARIKQQVGVSALWPYSLEDLINQFVLEPPRADELTLVAALPTGRVIIGPTPFPRTPLSLLSVLAQTNTTELAANPETLEVRDRTPWVLGGLMALTLEVQCKSGGTKQNAHPPTPQPGATPPENAQPTPDYTLLQQVPAGKLLLASGALAHQAAFSYRACNLLGELMEAHTTQPRRKLTNLEQAGMPSVGPPLPPGASGMRPPAQEAPGDNEASDEESLVSPAMYLYEAAVSDFEDGTFDGVGVTSEGHLRLVPKVAEVAKVDNEKYVWALLPAPEGLFMGTGNSGRIYLALPGGEVKLVADTKATAVTALCRASDGSLYAGLAPTGEVLHLASKTYKQTARIKLQDCDYVWGVVADEHGGCWAATGPEGRLFHISAKSIAEDVFDTKESHLLELVRGADGALYMGTAPNALIIRFDPKAYHSSVLAGLDGQEISALTPCPDGGVFAAVFPTGEVYRVTPQGQANLYYAPEDPEPVTALAAKDAKTCLVGGPTLERLYLVDSPSRWTLLYRKDDLVCSKAVKGANGALYVALANPARVLEVDSKPATKGTFLSPVRDGTSPIQWGEAFWGGEQVNEQNVKVETRTGNSPEPDKTWSIWGGPFDNRQGQALTNPPGRYLQYKLELTASEKASPELYYLKILVRTPNSAPGLQVKGLESGEAVNDTVTLQCKGTDPDDDPLVYSLFYRSVDETDWESAIHQQSKPALKWKVDSLAEGQYFVKILVSDVRTRAEQALSAEKIIGPVLVDTTRPELKLKSHSPEVTKSGVVVFEGFARDEGSGVNALQYSVDGGSRYAISSSEGAYSKALRLFKFEIKGLEKGKHVIKLFALDDAGNETAVKRTVNIK